MQNVEKLCLQWNDFKENVSSAFGELRGDRELTDVTLASEDGQQMEAHKVILAASSPFFMQLLKKNKHGHPLIYMRGVKFEDLAAIVDFLYLGEANVNQDRLDNFLSLAEELKLKGLTGRAETDDDAESNAKSTNQGREFEKKPNYERSLQQPEPTTGPSLGSDFRSKELVAATNSTVTVAFGELDEKIDAMINLTDRVDHKGRKLVQCNVCGNEGQKAHVIRHIEANHITGVNHSCELCGKTARSRNALRMHKYSNHSKVDQL